VHEPGAQGRAGGLGVAAFLSTLKDRASTPTALVLITFIVFLVVVGTIKPTVSTPQNMLGVLTLSSTTIITAVGFTIAVVAGVFDLSVGSAMMLTGVIFGTLAKAGVPLIIAGALTILLGTAIGVTNAILVVKLRINPIIATLGMLFALKGAGQLIGGGRGTQVPDLAFRFARNDVLGVPIPILIMAAVVIAGTYFLAYTPVGRRLTAVGDNSVGAREVALDVDRFRTIALVLCGTLAGLSGLVVASIVGAIDPQASVGRELDIATATFLGGASLAGGRGSIPATLIAVVLLGTLYNAFVQFGVKPEIVQVVSGALLVLAVAINTRPTGGYR